MVVSLLAALLVAAHPLAVATDSGEVTPARIDAVVEHYMAEASVPGMAVAITRGKAVVHAAGYGRTPSGEAVTERTPMAVASVSKSFTAIAVVQLAERGLLALDDPVVEHLPEFTTADPRSTLITARHLLDHTSGLTDRTTTARTVATPGEAVAALHDATLAADPGSAFEYHNPNYQVAARLVEVVSRKPFAEYLRDNVFTPLACATAPASPPPTSYRPAPRAT